MKIYVVGGAVRDALLGLPVQDHDHVVVGATPEQMAAAGFRPVGKDFPVFLHPKTQEEYALARTERKTAPGYHGFVFHTSPDVTLEDDLVRRDLTINAMARGDDGIVVDPYGGQRDLEARLFRHVSAAFAEDPVRILRVARFAARFAEFRVADETNALMRGMVEAGEADALVPERVWQEVARGLMERRPSRMFAVLRDCGALARIMPELDALWGRPHPQEADSGVRAMRVVDHAAAGGHTLAVRFAALVLDVAAIDGLCARLKVPNDCRDLALMTARELGGIGAVLGEPAESLAALFARCDAYRKPERFADMLLALECATLGGDYPQRPWLLGALGAARGVNAGEVAARCGADKAGIPAAVLAARVAAARTWMGQAPSTPP
ncbi:multifunctional CCA tRNA nucleotidyl transferase/2'3'-cyclic phosphodiesterase/2'nucleotidase/phosphatase [Massilia sp. IC2-278]|uniref:multifunctional CCA tRNA nucleotidyl transferase/2'3'-cyclic phosphodiesterase/2'nucleotidase/phosphatase n=1 Tax=Massilia sp. IC2-278 TaxID=2887200 RepID=UPI001E5EC74A|nr:multifunctional CCA tRNA nucleotidyl transferase/2'3'-cyclic phosphodiesterase/2'nucleotidase/phosphatase [Massilia sp. IC2-278]MCC2959844.1 multifunctional CCA tRNA nucleotidyl transferase/2'3'-cyclic phosphodiesterase/2'nucleotidase/phosphatase [Massilia sp. IC2-278]